MSLPISELAGGKACRFCGRLEIEIKHDEAKRKKVEKERKKEEDAVRRVKERFPRLFEVDK